MNYKRSTRSNMVRNPVIETYWGPMRIQIAHQCLNFYWLLSCLGQEAEQAIQCLNGKLALSKKLVVRWAHAQVKVSLGETEGKARHPSWVSEEPQISIASSLSVPCPCFALLCWHLPCVLPDFSLESFLRGSKLLHCFSAHAHRSCFDWFLHVADVYTETATGFLFFGFF